MRKDFEQFIAQVEQALTSGVAEVMIDLASVERLYPCGVLLLMGLVDNWIERFPERLRGRYPKDDLVEQMLQQVGVLEKLGLTARKVISHSDVTRWHYFTGMNVEAGKIEPFMEKVSELLDAEAQSGLYDCIAEAMTNVKHHAYEGGAGGHWWMFATISEKRIFVAMHDRGATIPMTLLAKPQMRDYLSARVFDFGARDSQLIAAAAGGRSRTTLPYRGKGLPEMLEYTKNTDKGSLAIYSRKGYFGFTNSFGKPAEILGKLDIPVDGTLILWMIDISGDRNE